MASTYTINQSREFADKMRKVPAITAAFTSIVESLDANNNPVVTFSDGTPAAGEKVIVVRMKQVAAPTGNPDALNLTQPYSFGPMVAQICTERNFEGTTDNVLDILRAAQLLPVIADLARIGSTMEWYETANGTVPSVAAIDGGTLTPGKYPGNIYWQGLSSR